MPEALQDIYDTYRWLGFGCDEGPDVGGPKGPYVQSERTAIYREPAERLVASGHAYRCWCSPERVEKFLVDKMKYLGTAACPPYHIAVVVGGTTAEQCLKTVKMASTKHYDSLPTKGSKNGEAFRDLELEKRLLEAANKLGIGAQFGGKYFAHDVRVVRLPRHGASCPVGMGVSCSADRNFKAKIDEKGIWIEELDHDPGRLVSLVSLGPKAKHEHGVKIDLGRPMKEILAQLTQYPVSTPLLLTGTLVVGRDIAHARFKELINQGRGVPDYLKAHPVYYAGPAKRSTTACTS